MYHIPRYTEMAILIGQYIEKHGSITYEDARQLTGCTLNQWWWLCHAIDRVLLVYVEDGRSSGYGDTMRKRILLRGNE